MRQADAVRKPSRSSAGATADLLLPALQQDFASESAASLGAAYRDLMKSMQAIADVEARLAEDEQQDDTARELALLEASESLWRFVVQRESCGFRNTDAVLRDMNIPASIRCRMGIRRPE